LDFPPVIEGTLGATVIQENIPTSFRRLTTITAESGSSAAWTWQDHEKVYVSQRFLILCCGFYLFGLLLSLFVALPAQALFSGSTTLLAAGVATLRLWLLAQGHYVETWSVIAIIGTVALPGGMIGLGLLFGGFIRRARRKAPAIVLATVIPFALAVVALVP
jgi:hypothetical protein